jgi:hypothetical protein
MGRRLCRSLGSAQARTEASTETSRRSGLETRRTSIETRFFSPSRYRSRQCAASYERIFTTFIIDCWQS